VWDKSSHQQIIIDTKTIDNEIGWLVLLPFSNSSEHLTTSCYHNNSMMISLTFQELLCWQSNKDTLRRHYTWNCIRNLAIAIRSRVSCAHNMSRLSYLYRVWCCNDVVMIMINSKGSHGNEWLCIGRHTTIATMPQSLSSSIYADQTSGCTGPVNRVSDS